MSTLPITDTYHSAFSPPSCPFPSSLISPTRTHKLFPLLRVGFSDHRHVPQHFFSPIVSVSFSSHFTDTYTEAFLPPTCRLLRSPTRTQKLFPLLRVGFSDHPFQHANIRFGLFRVYSLLFPTRGSAVVVLQRVPRLIKASPRALAKHLMRASIWSAPKPGAIE